MSFLLDTNICSEHLRKAAGLSHRFVQHSGRLEHSDRSSLASFSPGLTAVPNPDPLLLLIGELRADLQVLSYDEACAEQFGQLRGTLIRQGTAVSAAWT